jgi:hypothetical protein
MLIKLRCNIRRPGILALAGFFWCKALTVSAQVPTPLRPDITISSFIDVPANCAKLAQDPTDNSIAFINWNGNFYDIHESGGKYVSTLRATRANHGITILQGMAFKGNTVFLIGNIKTGNAGYVGKIMKGVKQPSGSRVWSTVMTTETYGITNTAFDHGFSGITVSPDSNYLFFNSGSRTDHGEIQNNGGLRPGLREEPLTSAIFRIPINSSNLILPNDSAKLASMGYLYADGTRNSFDLVFDKNGNLYGCENAGDRDNAEELNWLRQGHFYGFPWRMGGDNTPMQYPGYNPSVDKLIDKNSISYKGGYFYNDLTYPKKPNIPFTEAIVNLGPDADKYRDSISGVVRDAGDDGKKITTFTSHRSPLGLVFDRDSVLTSEFKGHGFIMGWTAAANATTLGPYAEDVGQDLLHIQLIYNSATDNYDMQTIRIAEGFNNPVDAEMIGNDIYVLEYSGKSPKIWKVTMPLAPNCSTDAYLTKEQYNNIPGAQIIDLIGNSSYPDHPSVTTHINSFESPLNTGDNFGTRIRGLITPPVTGNYTFWIAGTDQAELWLSTDATPMRKQKIATVSSATLSREYGKYPSQVSATIALTAGQKYYIETLQKAGTGGDNLSVKWQLPDGSTELPIACTRLSAYIPPAIDPLEANPLRVFPNPATNLINVRFAAKSTGNGEITISSIAGVRVYSYKMRLYSGDNIMTINSTKLSEGVYILQLKDGSKVYEKKVVIGGR